MTITEFISTCKRNSIKFGDYVILFVNEEPTPTRLGEPFKVDGEHFINVNMEQVPLSDISGIAKP